MISKPRESAILWWILFVVATLAFISCGSSMEQPSIGKRKYLEVDDLKSFDTPGSQHTGDEDIIEVHGDIPKRERPKKIERRSPRVDSGINQVKQKKSTRVAQPQAKKERPGFFWTLVKVTYETFNDTRSAIQQISQIINENIPNELVPQKPSLAKLKMKAATTTTSTSSSGNDTESESPTTTEEPEFKLTRPVLLSLVRRNVNGLVRLFKIEWRDAITQSQKNVKEFKIDLGKQVGMYLQDNPNNY